MKSLSVRVVGEPQTQGSKRHVGNGIMIESAKGLKPWRQDVRMACLQEAKKQGWNLEGHFEVEIDFVFARPKSHYTNKGLLTKNSPLYPRKDCDKLVRAILDSMISVVYLDDSQVVSIKAAKSYGLRGHPSGASIRVTLLN